MAELARQKEPSGGQDRNLLHRSTRNVAWLSTIHHLLNCMEQSWEELCGNLRLRYGLMHQDILATCDGCDDKFLIKHALSYPKGGLVLVWYDDAAKEWGALGSQSLTPIAIYYKPKTSIRTVQGVVPHAEHGRKGIHPKAEQTLLKSPNGVLEINGQETERLSWQRGKDK